MYLYFEWVQNIQSVSWSEEHVNEQLKTIMDQAFKAVWDISKEKETTLRTGAYLIAVKRVVDAKIRGICLNKQGLADGNFGSLFYIHTFFFALFLFSLSSGFARMCYTYKYSFNKILCAKA